MERTDFLTRRDFLQKTMALGTGVLLEALLCKGAVDLAQSFALTQYDQVNEVAPVAASASTDALKGQQAALSNSPPVSVQTHSLTVPDLFASQKTQIEEMRKGNWEGLFYLASDVIQKVSRQYDIPEDLIHALCFHESTCIPTERSKVRTDIRYSYARGATGLAQIMPYHAQQPDGGTLDLTDVQTNLIKMAQIFNAYRSKYAGDPDWARKTLYDYNAGPNRKVTPPETLQYAENIIALWKNPRRMKDVLIDQGWADMSLLYWDLLPGNPFSVSFVRTGVDFWEPYAGQPNHTGLDLGGPQIKIGTEIKAVAAGKVAYVGKMYDIFGISFSGRGNTVVLEHAPTNPLVSRIKFITSGYCHMSEFAQGIAPGAFVERGQVIGYVGMTGWTTGPHLHFECARNTPVNPTTRKMAREDGWFHPFLLLPPNQNHPGSKRLT